MSVLIAGSIVLGACSDADHDSVAIAAAVTSAEAVPTTQPSSTTSMPTPTPTPTMTPAPTPTPAPAPASTPMSTLTSTPASTRPPEDVIGRELVGRWAHYDVVAYEDGVLKTLIISYGFNDFTVDDGLLVDTSRFCFSEQRTDQPIETSLSDAATQAIEPPSTPVRVDVVDGVLTIRRPATPTPVGIRLENPFEQPLPSDPDDPRIVDDDGDGEPGITVGIRVTDELSGELYIARREIFAYEVSLVEPDLLTGTVTDESEQLVIGASDPVFLSDADWTQHPDPDKSPIILRRVDAGWDCDRLAAERDRLFPPTPEVDW